MKQISPFFFEGTQRVRTVLMNGEAWFIAKDVCDVLGYKNPRDALARHVDDEDKNTVGYHDGIRGNPNRTVISLPGLLYLVMLSNLPAAKKFRRWVISVVLPSVLKTGSFSVTGYRQPTRIAAQNQISKLMDKLRKERHPIVRRTTYSMLEELCQGLQIETPPLDSLGSGPINL